MNITPQIRLKAMCWVCVNEEQETKLKKWKNFMSTLGKLNICKNVMLKWL